MFFNSGLPFVFLLLLLLTLSANGKKQFEKYFYWRHFNGSIPDDAVPGGYTLAGDKSYIGSTVVSGLGLLPATIYRNDRFAYSNAFGKEVKADLYTMILCAEPDKQPIWKWVDNRKLPSDCYFIEGGSEDNYPLSIGRLNIKGIYYLGKVFPAYRNHYQGYNGMEIYADKFIGKIQEFEILAYCPSEGSPDNDFIESSELQNDDLVT